MSTISPQNGKKAVLCLGYCGKPFKSPDPSRVRVCPRCRRKQETEAVKYGALRQTRDI
jgi:hypothetical protein